jgi:integrase
MSYLEDIGVPLGDVSELPYSEQHLHFTNFLQWVKGGNHNGEKIRKIPSNTTCNTYLRDVFGWFGFLELEYEQFHDLKVLSSRIVTFSNDVGVRFSMSCRTFKGYFKNEPHIGRTIEKENIIILLEACVNCRDQLMLLLLAETGFRIGEILGIRYTEDIDYDKRLIRVEYREDNENAARAKNAEYRRAKFSKETNEILLYYLAQNRALLKDGDYLFINIAGKSAGQPEKANTVYAMLERLEKKTGVKATPHMLRHYYANERRKNGWDIALISKALGHKHISTTEQYLNIEDDELSEATDAYYKNNQSLYEIDKLL